MKTIIAEKPSVAREIARLVGATKPEEGYMHGNGYYVTWAFGHLVQPALPEGYGIKGFQRDNLPVIPDEFQLVPRQVRTEKGYKADSGVMKQIRTITRLFNDSDRIIVATDAGREGELIFRYLYHYTGCTVPFDRLWISSLTDKAIREGLANLEDGTKYDNLYLAAKSRSEADWLVGINGTQALTIAAGRGTYSVGRVQTPTLAMVCARFWENKRFVPQDVFQTHFSTRGKDADSVAKFSSVKKWNVKGEAAEVYGILKEAGTVAVLSVERKETVQEAPLLYDLTALQKDANARHGFTAEKTLAIAQKLYESKLITYPRTGSRYIPEDVFAGIPSLLKGLKGNPKWDAVAGQLRELNRRSVDDTKVTDHHALLPTGVKPLLFSKEDTAIYDMIVARMLEAFSGKCVKDVTTVKAGCGGVEFVAKGNVVKQYGWRSVRNEKEEGEDNVVLPEWKEGDILPIMGCSLTEGKTKPKPFHTEATLLAAMETAGKEVEDEVMRQAMKDCGIGTPATRAAIIETLLKREYIVRSKKSLVPTEKGLALYSIVRGMDIANVEMTGQWEAALAKIEHGELPAEAFMRDIEAYTRKITTELLACDKIFGHKDSGISCPKCGDGRMQFFGRVVRCDNTNCGLPVFRQIAGKTLSDTEMADLLKNGQTGLLNGFRNKQGKPFSAVVAFDGDFNTVFEFPEKKNKSDKTGRKRK
ncbi:type IA DNA topoisomerase [Odoribacter splanchnicus]|uniref:type IA DNA topoisomerase n=1 Tax=Odoribacter splanchnicus TaxID=28118 RepID=UPI000E4890AD|nr:type IA DNA topoisomerase [Odoribacter splanchnicus]RHA38644.1 type IA DNA topoisomerase [Odoribacter splanchnicus]